MEAVTEWNLAWFLFAFPLPYLGAYVLLLVGGAITSWRSIPKRSAIIIGTLALLAPLQAALVAAGFVIGIELTIPLFVLAGFLSPLEWEGVNAVLGLLAVFSTCALMGAVLGRALSGLRRRLGLIEADQLRAWRIVDIGAGALAGALTLPAGRLLGHLILPQNASGGGSLVRLAMASGIIAAIFAPHALAAWRLMRRSRLQTRVSWGAAAGYALVLYLLLAVLVADQRHRFDLAWPWVHLEARQTPLEVGVERRRRPLPR